MPRIVSVFFQRFSKRDGPPSKGGDDSALDWLRLALNARLTEDPERFSYSNYLQRSILTFGNSLFLQAVPELAGQAQLLRAVRDLLSRVAPGIQVTSVKRRTDASSPEFELKFEMVLDMSRVGGPKEATVRADFAVATQRASIRTL